MLAASLFASASSFAQAPIKIGTKQKVNAAELKATLNPNDASFLAVPENNVEGLFPQGGQQKVMKPVSARKLMRADEAKVDTV